MFMSYKRHHCNQHIFDNSPDSILSESLIASPHWTGNMLPLNPFQRRSWKPLMLFLRLTGMSSMSIMRTRITYHICMRILIHWHEPVNQRIITRLKTFHMIALKPYMEYQRISAEIIMRS